MVHLKSGRQWIVFAAALVVLGAATASAQTPDGPGYSFGDERRLQIVVHILGEVGRPGEYVVSDDTSVLELISKAGGATEFGNLGDITIKRGGATSFSTVSERESAGEIIKVDITEFLSRNDAKPLPILQPDDVVVVPRNRFSKWTRAFTIVRDVGVVATTYLLYLRVTE